MQLYGFGGLGFGNSSLILCMSHNHYVVAYSITSQLDFYFDSDLEIIHVLCQNVVDLGEKLAAYSALGARTAFNSPHMAGTAFTANQWFWP